jgi:uncharacterized delta-60 repeat protein
VGTAALAITSVTGSEAGAYTVVITNMSGAVTSSVATLTVYDPKITSSPTTNYLSVGQTVNLTVSASGSGPLHYQWRKNGVEIPSATNTLLSLVNVQLSDAATYDTVVTNIYASVTSSPSYVSINGSFADSFGQNANDYVFALTPQPDGKILVAGVFSSFGGKPASAIARMNADGSLDTNFVGGADNYVFSVALQEDGKILVGGWFTYLNGQLKPMLGRLKPDGSLDTNFLVSITGAGSLAGVYSIGVQDDGKILVAGGFAFPGGSCTNIGRLNPDGTVDTTFSASANDIIYPIAIQPDGKIVVAGEFTTLCGQPRSHIGRLNSNGTLDTSFDPGMDSTPVALRVQNNGQIVVGGGYDTLAGTSRKRIGRINADGTIDASFNPGANGVVRSVLLQTDGKLLVAGEFTVLGGLSRSRIARLNPDGSVDMKFAPDADSLVYGITLQPDGKILVGGGFSMLGGQSRARFGRLNNTDAATTSLIADYSTVTWQRGGGSPEAHSVRLDFSTNGNNWTTLGWAARTIGGWTGSSANVPVNATIRARAFVVSGRYNASGWYADSTMVMTSMPPVLLLKNAGFNAGTFGFDLVSDSGRVAVIDGGTDLVNWASLMTNTFGSSPLHFDDYDATNYQKRFYRGRLQ